MREDSLDQEKIVDKTDRDLVTEFQEGKESAFDELVRRHMEKAVQLAFAVVGNYEDAKDVSQEAFVKAYRALKTFQQRSKFSTWLYRILINTAKDFWRRKKWERFLKWDAPESMESFLENVEDRSPSPANTVLSGELDQKISQAVKRLPLKQQWMFLLRFVEGLSIQEISEITETREGTVKATLHFAIQKLKVSMNAYLGERRAC